jgi:hypothetical protein
MSRVISRDRVISRLRKSYPDLFISTTDEFNGGQGGIWLCGEGGDEDRNGMPIFDYWASGNSYVIGVIDHLNRWANRNGWYFEWNDPGTIMMWPI